MMILVAKELIGLLSRTTKIRSSRKGGVDCRPINQFFYPIVWWTPLFVPMNLCCQDSLNYDVTSV